MQISIINGIYTDETANFRVSFPRNLIPVPKSSGISDGYLKPADGIVEFGEGSGIDRGAINWNGVYYRVMGSKLCKISSNGTLTEIGDVGNDGKQTTLKYSFDYLAIASNNNLFLYDGATLQQVTDTDLGNVIDVVWVDGYFMTTDGEFLIVTELNNPFEVNPLKYGSSEINPDNVVALKMLHNEVYAINRYSIEVFDNVGGVTFPFQRVNGAQIDRGAIGTKACTEFMGAIAFLGNALNESPAIYIGASGGSRKISTQDIDNKIQSYTEEELSEVILETRTDKSHSFLYVHFKDCTLVYDGNASSLMGIPVWHTLTSSLVGQGQYRARNFVYCYDKWLCGDSTANKHGYLTDTISSHYGERIGWDFNTSIVYNEGRGAIFHELELVALTGRVQLGEHPTIWTSYSVDGETWSQEFAIQAGKKGDRTTKLSWLRQGIMQNWRIQKFRGTSDAFMSVARLEARIEPLMD